MWHFCAVTCKLRLFSLLPLNFLTFITTEAKRLLPYLRERPVIFILSQRKLQSTSLFNSSHPSLRIRWTGSSSSFLKLYLPLDNIKGCPEILAKHTCLPWMRVVSFVFSAAQKGNKVVLVWVIDQVWGQDGWILAKFFFFRVSGLRRSRGS